VTGNAEARESIADVASRPGRPGRLIAIGGLVDRPRERELLRAFFEAAGGSDANLVVLAAAAEPAELRDLATAAERFGDVFYDLGAESVEVLRLGTAAAISRLDLLENATGLFLVGGSLWLPLPDDPALSETVRRRHGAGMVVGGSGAGAALLADFCIAPGVGGPGRRRALGLAPGFCLTRGLLLDPPLRQRDRLGRLLAALALDPTPLAVGIDDDTAVILDPLESTLDVLGAGAVMVVDATQAIRPGLSPDSSNAGDIPPMLGVRVDLLTAGCRYDLRERRGQPGTVHGVHGVSPWRLELAEPQGE
jgi:cyanophycinase